MLDASAAIEMLLRSPAGVNLEQRIMVAGAVLHAPHHIDAEVAHTLRRYELSGELTPDRARHALGVWRSLAIVRHAVEPLLDRIWELRHNFSGYDAAYVALAESLDLPLLTADAGLAGGTGQRARIELFR